MKKIDQTDVLHGFTRPIDVEDIPAGGTTCSIIANESEKQELAETLDLLRLSELTGTFEVHPIGGGRFCVTGNLRAKLTQTCVVTLDPVDSLIDEAVNVQFWPMMSDSDTTVGDSACEIVVDPSFDDDPEFYEARTIDLGHLVFEVLSSVIDPYPKIEGAAFDWIEDEAKGSEGADPQSDNPFAILDNLKFANKK